jgi:SAM-dependent methyltransferase
MTRGPMQVWRKLIAETIGTERYWWIALQNAAFYRDMEPLVAKYAAGRALDMGAGQLAWKDLLTRHVEVYTSGDLTPGHRQLDVVFDVTGGLPFADESFDTVFCCSVLEHAVEPWRAFSEMRRVLSAEGKAIVSVPFLFPLHDEPHDYYRFTGYGVRYLAQRSGFQVEEMVVNGGLFHLLLNVPSVVMSTICVSLRARGLIKPFTRFWLDLARKLDRLDRLKDVFASNHIVVLRKTAIRNDADL